MHVNQSLRVSEFAKGVPLSSRMLPKKFLRQSYSVAQQRLRKHVKTGLLSSIAVSDSDLNEDLILTLRMVDSLEKHTESIILQCEHGELRVYNYALFLQALSGFMVDASSAYASDESKGRDSFDGELLSLAVARLPKSFTDIFGFLSFTSKDVSTLQVINSSGADTESPMAAFTSESGRSDNLSDDQDYDYDIEPVFETTPQTDTTEKHCMSVRLAGKNVSLHCLIEADTQCWLNILNHPALQSNRISSPTSARFKRRVPCTVGKVTLNTSMINQLSEGDILLLDESYINESNNLSLSLSGKSYQLCPQNDELNRFSVLLDNATLGNVPADKTVKPKVENIKHDHSPEG